MSGSEDGPPPSKALKLSLKGWDELKRVKRDNLRASQGMSASGSGVNNVHVAVRNILQENSIQLPVLHGLNTPPAGKKLREEEDPKEREKKVENERKRKGSKSPNKALAAFMKTTDAKNQTKEWGERSLRRMEACPFCDRCAIVVVQDEFVFPL